jgi:CubicO group peptidase (beta-lactamase class C family)
MQIFDANLTFPPLAIIERVADRAGASAPTTAPTGRDAIPRFVDSRTFTQPLSFAERANRVDQYYEQAVKHGFSGSVLVAKDDRILLAKGFGEADRAKHVPNTKDTLYDIGSLTKQFVAASILQLVEKGKVSLDDPISKYLSAPKAKANITIRELLMHRSGLDYPTGDGNPRIDPRDGRAYLEDFLKNAPLRSKPGTSFYYNNVNYDLLAYVVQSASGERYEDYLTNHLFRPAGMTHTGFNIPGTIDRDRAAIGYDGPTAHLRAGDLPNDWGYKGATGVVTSVEDLFKWTMALRTGNILSADSRALLFTPAPGKTKKGESPYAMGWMVDVGKDGKPARVFHDGSTEGFLSLLTMDLKNGVTVITLSNDFKRGDPYLGSAERIMNPQP